MHRHVSAATSNVIRCISFCARFCRLSAMELCECVTAALNDVNDWAWSVLMLCLKQSLRIALYRSCIRTSLFPLFAQLLGLVFTQDAQKGNNTFDFYWLFSYMQLFRTVEWRILVFEYTFFARHMRLVTLLVKSISEHHIALFPSHYNIFVLFYDFMYKRLRSPKTIPSNWCHQCICALFHSHYECIWTKIQEKVSGENLRPPISVLCTRFEV